MYKGNVYTIHSDNSFSSRSYSNTNLNICLNNNYLLALWFFFWFFIYNIKRRYGTLSWLCLVFDNTKYGMNTIYIWILCAVLLSVFSWFLRRIYPLNLVKETLSFFCIYSVCRWIFLHCLWFVLCRLNGNLCAVGIQLFKISSVGLNGKVVFLICKGSVYTI